MTIESDNQSKSWKAVGHQLAEQFDREYWTAAIEGRRFPIELWQTLGHDGRLSVLVPVEHGGAGKGLTEAAAMTQSLGASGFPILSLITSVGLALPTIADAGSNELRESILPGLCRGETFIAFAITEADAGTNIMNLATSAEVEDGQIVLNGSKMYTSAADVADYVMVVARTRDDDHDRLGFSIVVVPTDAAGLDIEPATTRIAAAERQSILRFDKVVLPLEYVVGVPARGLRALAPALATERILAGALAAGVGQFCLDRAVEHSRERVIHDRPIGAYQGVQHPLARAHVGLAGARLLLDHAAHTADQLGARAVTDAEIACVSGTTAGFEAADAALQAIGGRGYTREGEVHSMFQLSRLLRSAPVHTESSLNSIAEMELGLPRSY